jgi:hypothetical protein
VHYEFITIGGQGKREREQKKAHHKKALYHVVKMAIIIYVKVRGRVEKIIIERNAIKRNEEKIIISPTGF